jgi:glycosyltransferase involved in cell wall biosynthesis
MSIGVWRGLRGLAIPYVLYTHGMLVPFFNRFPWKRFKKLVMWRLLEHRVLRDASKVIFTCDEELRVSSQNFTPFACKPEILSLGIDGPPEKCKPSPSTSASWPADLAGKQVFLYLARLEPQKGCDTLVLAFARVAAAHPNVHLLMAGPDTIGWKRELMALAMSSGATERITWYGPVFGDAKWELFRKADAYILPSNFENFGISIVEALASGLPVLISDKAMIWREVQAAGAGFISSNTIDGTAAILEKWIATPPEERARMRANAFHCFEEHYSINAVANKLAAILESVARH